MKNFITSVLILVGVLGSSNVFAQLPHSNTSYEHRLNLLREREERDREERKRLNVLKELLRESEERDREERKRPQMPRQSGAPIGPISNRINQTPKYEFIFNAQEKIDAFNRWNRGKYIRDAIRRGEFPS